MDDDTPVREKTYHVLSLRVDEPVAEGLCDSIRARFAREPVTLHRPEAGSVWVEVYFDDEISACLAGSVLHAETGVTAQHIRQCQPRDWRTFWRHHFKPRPIGRRLCIEPFWDTGGPARGDRLPVILDPGLSFGTGENFTTRYCLEMMEAIREKEAVSSLADLGTGSGILAIAAVRLGYTPVLGVDHDPESILHARKNAGLNDMADRITWRSMDLTAEMPEDRYDVVCANLFANLLVDIAPRLARVTRRHLVLSGVQEHQAEEVAAAFVQCGGREWTRDGDGCWCGMTFTFGR